MKNRQPGTGLSHRYRSLQALHREIDQQINIEMERPLPDFLAIQALKRQRLKTKDELANLGRKIRTAGRPALSGAA